MTSDICAAAPPADAPLGASAKPVHRTDGRRAAGTALFWVLVIALVAARTAWFEPDAGDGTGRVPRQAAIAPAS